MPKLSKILVGVDFSPLSLAAVDLALELARGQGGRLSLLYVVEPIDFAGLDAFGGGVPVATQGLVEEHVDRAREELQKLAKRRLKAIDGVKLDVRIGRPAEELVAAGGAGRGSLIVLGTHGRHGIAHLLMGSVAERVVRHARCPVLVVPAAATSTGR